MAFAKESLMNRMKISDRHCVMSFQSVFIKVYFVLVATNTPCALRSSKYGFVCFCNVTYCDYLEPVSPKVDGFVLTSSSKEGLRFSRKIGQFSNNTIKINDYSELKDITNEPNVQLIKRGNRENKIIQSKASKPRDVTIKIDRTKKYQEIVGFGGAFTGAVSDNLKHLPQELQDAVYLSYFSKKGIGYSMIRMPIGGCDFDLEPWAYNELPENDVTLSNFTKLNYLDETKIEQINRLKSVANITNIKIMGTAWSPPKWMKTINSWTGLNFLQTKYYQTWADYHLRFIELMASKNMPIWAITTGNEPLNGVIGWVFVHFMSLGWTASSQAEWVADNLGPTIRNSKFKDVKIFSNDDQRYTFPSWFESMNETRKESIDYLDGLGVHWYWDEYLGPSLIDQAHELMPNKLIFNTESSLGDKPTNIHAPLLGSWKRAEKYARSYLEDLQHSFNGYFDWNLILNEQGGPSYADNFIDTAVVVNTTSGQEIYKQPIFYVIGHFSKFIPEGSIRIDAERSNTNINTVAFVRPDGTITCIFYNSAKDEVAVTLVDSIRGNIEITIPPKSLHTIEYN
ncbi:lysosomal acid glucosylceramidase-like [Eupeodes corollae]|uniref:lysosomal acid glucosylceramidase-like n=1 Tax=Eupeodes corollae TaxID=290404 RepID=UPI00248F52F1|nr:lysosomal acid glucosylceramidase-like [Eupeodes corollae]